MKFTSSYGSKIGQPPGSYKHGKNEPVRVTFIEYDNENYSETSHWFGDSEKNSEIVKTKLREFVQTKDKKNLWVNIDGIFNENLLETIGKKLLNIHSLTLEDIVNTDQRPKYENYETYDLMVLRILRRNSGLSSEQISMILMDKLLITFQEIQGDCFDNVRERLRQSNGRIRKKHADYLAYSLLDSVVDSYFIILESFETDLNSLDAELVEDPKHDTLIKIHSLKGELMQIKKTVSPMREMLSSMERTERNFIDDKNNVFLRDAYDHVIRILETTETLRDMLYGMMDIYMSTTSMKLNEIMKVLTIISTVFIPITFITSVYGMNFEGIEEIHFKYGYVGVWVVMLTIAGSLLLYFKKKKWL